MNIVKQFPSWEGKGLLGPRGGLWSREGKGPTPALRASPEEGFEGGQNEET